MTDPMPEQRPPNSNIRDYIFAPFSEADQHRLRWWQRMMHPYTCPFCGGKLEVGELWTCPTPGCDYTQSWAMRFDPWASGQPRGVKI